ncbi:DUF2267 domain-containing protein [Streptomyces sp. NBC_01497]|uniref:DUF2267 domain-containing protein n=1 Tax=Streptomyces sp. NBC_01497 TaxID=2903885 RepID=UPI002E2F8CB9|nr:DUF2267 domain-containing protein [Streptomyces sp. NBC_01497]
MRHSVPVVELKPTISFEQMLERIRYAGAYPTRERAEEAVRLVLGGLGRQLARPEREKLAERLPRQAAQVLAAQAPDPEGEPLTGCGFVKELASRTDTALAPTRWDTGSVLTAVAALAGPELLTHILAQLPTGWALLFGRPELRQAA